MRLLTRLDFDGMACATLLEHLGLINEWKFVHPKDIQDGLVIADDNDILANIPYVKGCKLWFDHHSSEAERLGPKASFEGVSRVAPSCARVIYDYYGGDEKLGWFSEMIRYVDKVDSGNLTMGEILHPSGWVLLGFLLDPRTGLGRLRGFSINNEELMKKLTKVCSEKVIDEILEMPDVQERINLYREQSKVFCEMVKEYTKTVGNAIFTDLRGVENICTGNRFLVYTMFPEQNISVWVIDGKMKVNVAITMGYSITNRSATVDVGSLMLLYGGGGHSKVGTCQVPSEDADRIIAEILDKIK
jgi:nanoRNase/pAp phosphatase (c-di-AMP/oligoRNAs hydrolase)